MTDNGLDDVESLRLAIAVLTEIAAFGDDSASRHLAQTGSYAAFDEPGSVETAREALAKIIRTSLPPSSYNLTLANIIQRLVIEERERYPTLRCTVLLNLGGGGSAILSTLEGDALAREIEMFKATLAPVPPTSSNLGHG